MNADQQRADSERGSHWADQADHPVADWQAEVAADDTRLSYQQWVTQQRLNDPPIRPRPLPPSETAEWRNVYAEEDVPETEAPRLLYQPTELALSGRAVPLHIQAIAVDKEGNAINPADGSDLDALYLLSDGSSGFFQTYTINGVGRGLEYVIFGEPYRD